MITDQIIINLFFSKKGNRTNRYQKIIDNNLGIKSYLDSRYSDCIDYNETLWRIKLGYENVPICPVCGEHHVRFYGSCQIGFSQTCSKQCQTKLWHLNQIKTIKQKYGVENCFQSTECKEKIKKTNLERYGVTSCLQNKNIMQKSKYTCLKKYGVTNGGASKQAQDKIKKHMLEKYGVINPGQIPEVKKKIRETLKKHNSFNTSKPENIVYDKLCSKFNDVRRQFRSKLYPFNCDFYIPSLDLYIECNYHWTHGFHLFDENNIDDLAKLELWKQRNTKYYNSAINVWTNRDILKFNTAINNNLNYQVFYTLDETLSFIETI